jgi:glyoxylase-like metal-dependent hydrolase (beta-lactamase superfamily II)
LSLPGRPKLLLTSAVPRPEAGETGQDRTMQDDAAQEITVQDELTVPGETRPSRHLGQQLPVARPWFEVTEVGADVFRITEPYVHHYVRSNAWLIRGATTHLLVDQGLGIGRLSQELAGKLDRPVVAVATHSHFDHFGGLGEFADRAAHPDDGDVIEQAGDYVTLQAASYPAALLAEFEAAGEPVPELLIDALPYAGFDLASFRTPAAAITRWLADGDKLELGGGRTFEIIHAPGHSPGSICLWDPQSGALVSGDVIVDGEPLLDELPRSSPADFAVSLRRLADLPMTAVYAGHGPVIGRGRALDIISDYLTSRNR